MPVDGGRQKQSGLRFTMLTQVMNPAGRFGNDYKFGSVGVYLVFCTVDLTDVQHKPKTLTSPNSIRKIGFVQ
jgi:hypothetical protein